MLVCVDLGYIASYISIGKFTDTEKIAFYCDSDLVGYCSNQLFPRPTTAVRSKVQTVKFFDEVSIEILRIKTGFYL